MILTGYDAVQYAISNNLPVEFKNRDSECPADRVSSLDPSEIVDAVVFVPSHAEMIGYNLNVSCSLKAAVATLTHQQVVDACITAEDQSGFMRDVRLASDECFTHGDTISMVDGTVLVYRTEPRACWYTITNEGYVVAKDPTRSSMIVLGAKGS